MNGLAFLPRLGRIRRSPLVRPFLAAGAAGALAFALWAETPVSTPPPSAASVEWRLPALPEGPPAEVLAVWQQPVWASQGGAVADTSGRPAQPRFTLLGVVQSGERLEALLSTDTGQRLRRVVGDPLPGGGALLRVSLSEAVWTDADGHETVARVLQGPPPSPAGASPASSR